jgi:hypothetical protein
MMSDDRSTPLSPSQDQRGSYDVHEDEYDDDRLDDEIEALERSTFAVESGGLMMDPTSGPGT